MFIVSSKTVIRSDGSFPNGLGQPSWNDVVKGIALRLRSDPHVIALFPMFFVSRFYFPYMFNDINLANFNIRTRALNIVLFYSAGIAGAFTAGSILDTGSLRRSVRIKIAVALLVTGFTSIWTGALVWQRNTTRSQTEAQEFQLIDCTNRAYVGPLFLFLSFGFVHFIFLNCIYYFIAALADSSETASTADFSGFFVSIDAFGVAVSWKISDLKLPFMTDLAVVWGLTIGSILVAAVMLIIRIGDFDVCDIDEPKYCESDQSTEISTPVMTVSFCNIDEPRSSGNVV